MQEIKLKNFSNEQQVEIALIVATSIELDTALKFLMPYDEDQEIYKIQEHENTYYCGLFGVYSTVIVKSNLMGSIGLGASLQTTSAVIETFKPKVVIMGGIAFGKDPEKQKFGDILISDSIVSYGPTRRNKNGDITYRGAKPNASITLLNRFSQINEYTVVFEENETKVALFRGPLLSGEVLIDNQEFKNELTKSFPDVIGGEMEGIGVYGACQKNNIPWIIIKSICDWADGDKDKTKQSFAAFTSLSFIHDHLKSELIFESLGITSTVGKEQESQEINIEALDILKLIVSKRDMKKISKNKGTRNREKKIYYEYYKLDDEKTCKGYLFLGNHITNNNVFEDFLQKQKNSLPDTLEIFLAKKRKNTHMVDRKKSIYERTDHYGLKKAINSNIHYIDDFIWENTFSETEEDSSHIRNDFIDQKLYSVDLKTNKTFFVGESLNYFVEQINNQSTPISIVLGTGGVGKTTFCDSLQHTINNNSLRKRVFYIKGEKVVKFFLNSPEQRIESLDDLYDLYKEETDFLNIEKDEFNLNFISGNAIVLIDAIEEIESALNERFNLQGFFNSLKKLYARFYSTKIIVTTREHFLPKIKSLEGNFSIAYYMLQGFEKNNLDSFLIKRYRDDQLKRNAVKKFLDENRLFTEQELVVPLFVDWACQIIDRPETNSKIESKYFCTQYAIDKLIINLLDREITKQSLNINIDGMFKLLEEIIIQYRGIMPKQDFKEYIEIESNQGMDNFVKNPLFIQEGEFIKIKYDILHNIIKSRYLRYSLINKQIGGEQTIILLKEMFLGKGDLFTELIHILHLDMEQAIDNLGFFIREFAKKYFDDFKSIDKENIRKCISGLLYLTMHSVNKKDQTEITEVLKKIYLDNSKIKGLFIYGAFYSINFSDINIIDGLFDNYSNFAKCNFSTREDKIFYFVTFRNMQLPIVKSIKKVFFDTSCNYIESNINEITAQFDSSSNKRIEQVKRDFIVITKYIETSQKSENLIKKHCTIQDNRGIKKFLSKLVSIGYLEIVGNDLYKISKKYYDQIPSIKLGNFIDEIEDFLEDLIVA